MELLPKLVKGTQAVTAQGRLYAYLQTATAQYRVSEEIARIKSFLVSQQSRFLGQFGCRFTFFLLYFIFYSCLVILMRSLSAVTAFFGGVTHTRSGSRSSWESSSGVNIILHHCSRICHTALSTFMSGLVMGSSDVGGMELQRATPTTLERLCMLSPKGLSNFGARENLMVPNSLMLHASLFFHPSLLPSFTPHSWLVDRTGSVIDTKTCD